MMNISFEKKILIGYIINFIVLLAVGLIYWGHMFNKISELWHWISLALILLSVGMITVVYVIILAQLKAKNKIEGLLLENEKLIQSIIDNTTNPISVKKINGEYLLINKQYELLFNLKKEQIAGKTDHDLFSKEIADKYRAADLESVKMGKQMHIEETIEQDDGTHTYLSVKFPLMDSSNRVFAVGTISTDITEREADFESLKAADVFFNISPDLMVIASTTAFIKINPATSKTLGFSEEELLGKPFISFVHPDDVDITVKEIEKLKTGVVTINFEDRFVCKDGSYKWLNWTAYPEVETGLLYAVARDVTEKKEHESNLIAADKFFNMSLDLLIISTNDKFVKVNPAVTKLLGYSESEMLDKPFSTFIFSEDLSATEKTLIKLQKGAAFVNIKNRIVSKDGSIKWLSWSAVFDTETKLFYAVARDITEQLKIEQKAKEELEESYENEQKLTLILENIGDGVLVADSNRNVLLANYMVNELFGVEEDSKIPVNFSNGFELLFPDEKTTFPVQNLPMEKALKGEITDDIDVVLRNPTSNEKKRVLLSGRPIIDLQKNVVAAVITIKDITNYKMMEKELIEKRKIIGFKKDIEEVK